LSEQLLSSFSSVKVVYNYGLRELKPLLYREPLFYRKIVYNYGLREPKPLLYREALMHTIEPLL
jgi:hypothetical protein